MREYLYYMDSEVGIRLLKMTRALKMYKILSNNIALFILHEQGLLMIFYLMLII